MNTTQQTFTGWCCTDCLMILANGEDNPEWSENEATAHHAAMSRKLEGCEVTLGLMASEHDEDCLNRECKRWVDECQCEHDEFSWSSCDTCGSSLGGAREAVTFWINKDS